MDKVKIRIEIKYKGKTAYEKIECDNLLEHVIDASRRAAIKCCKKIIGISEG